MSWQVTTPDRLLLESSDETQIYSQLEKDGPTLVDDEEELAAPSVGPASGRRGPRQRRLQPGRGAGHENPERAQSSNGSKTKEPPSRSSPMTNPR